MRGECARVDEDAFGPVVEGCLDGFDFTLLFEETILFVLPALCLLLLALVWRAPELIRANVVVRSSLLGFSKLVSSMLYQSTILATSYPNKEGAPKLMTQVTDYLSSYFHLTSTLPCLCLQEYFGQHSSYDPGYLNCAARDRRHGRPVIPRTSQISSSLVPPYLVSPCHCTVECSSRPHSVVHAEF